MILFNSLAFIFLFLPLTLAVFWLLRTKKLRYAWVVVMGYFFYCLWDYRFALLLLGSALLNFLMAKYIYRHSLRKQKHNDGNDDDERNCGKGFKSERLKSERSGCLKRNIAIAFAITIDLALLGFFKYYNFAAGMANSLLPLLGIGPGAGAGLGLPILNIILPLGISFYTFQSISYIIDVYSGKTRPAGSFLEFMCYISFIPQILSGPIVRYDEMRPSLEAIDNSPDSSKFYKGINLFVLGLAKKVIIADTISALISPMIIGHSSLTTITAWIAAIGYAFQLYFDFSGYTDMALGIGCFFALELPKNFNSPYKALNISDFWRRWHMSLTRWVNDYLFLPLTLSGKGITKPKILIASLLTMLILGVWHGAGWTFMLFGLYHGIMLVLYQLTKKGYDKLPALVRRILTFIIVVVGFVIFRSDSIAMLIDLLGRMFSFTGGMPFFNLRLVLLLAALVISSILSFFFKNTNEIEYHFYARSWALAIVMAFIFVICVIAMGRAEVAFLYYQF